MSISSVLTALLIQIETHRIPYLALLCLCSLLAFLLFGMDKYKAKRGLWRISERTLLLSAFFFGGAGAFLGMLVFRHKTKHRTFRILVPLFLLLQFVLLAALRGDTRINAVIEELPKHRT